MTEKGKRIVFDSLAGFRAPDLFLRLSGRPRIFLYHGVSPLNTGGGIYNYRRKFVPPELFRRELEWISRHFTITPLPQLVERMQKKEVLPPRIAAITFDDGYHNVYEHAFPILKDLSIPATCFLTTDLVDQKAPLWVDILEYAIGYSPNPTLTVALDGEKEVYKTNTYRERVHTDLILREHLKKRPYKEVRDTLNRIVEETGMNLSSILSSSSYRGMTWNDARDMERSGITFAPHTRSHPILTRVSLEEARDQIVWSKERLEKELESPLSYFAYPNGQADDFSKDISSLVASLGFSSAYTTIPRTVSEGDNIFALPRITLDGTTSFSAFKTTASGLTETLRSLSKAFK